VTTIIISWHDNNNSNKNYGVINNNNSIKMLKVIIMVLKKRQEEKNIIITWEIKTSILYLRQKDILCFIFFFCLGQKWYVSFNLLDHRLITLVLCDYHWFKRI